MPIGTYYLQRGTHPKLLLLIGACIFFPLYYLSLLPSSFFAFAFMYAFAYTMNQGLTYMAPVHHSWLWFPKHPGLMSGIILAGFGFGPFVINFVATAIINPTGAVPTDGEYPDYVNERFELMIYSLGAIYFGFFLIGLAGIFPGPEPLAKLEKANEFAETGFVETSGKQGSTVPVQY